MYLVHTKNDTLYIDSISLPIKRHVGCYFYTPILMIGCTRSAQFLYHNNGRLCTDIPLYICVLYTYVCIYMFDRYKRQSIVYYCQRQLLQSYSMHHFQNLLEFEINGEPWLYIMIGYFFP